MPSVSLNEAGLLTQAPQVPTVYFVSLGCPKNRVDTEVMLGLSQNAGHRLTDRPEDADVIVVNTCGFIGAAKEESVDTILEMAAHKRTGRCRRLVVTGCLSQRYPTELHHEIPEIDHILGSGEVEKIALAITSVSPGLQVAQVPTYLYDHSTPRPASQAPFSRYVKIAEGCDRPCAFCFIPKLRGPQRSRPLDSIAAEVAALSLAGVVEVNLVAQDLTMYGTDLPQGRKQLPELLQRLSVPRPDPGHLRWIRLHYAYPTAVTDALLRVMADSQKVVRYLDCPLQHVDDRLLKLMRRGHTQKTVERFVGQVRKVMPDVFLRSAFIVGHPGETEQAFAALCDFVRQAEIDHVGVFTYSQEEGTPSGQMVEQVPHKVAVQRQRELLRVQRAVVKKKRQALIGRTVEVLVEGPSAQSAFVFQGRHAGQAPEIDGQVYLVLGEACPELALTPGAVVEAKVTRGAEVDLVAEVLGMLAKAPAKKHKLPVVR